MNVQAPIRQPAPVKLTVEDFLLLKQSGRFAEYWRPELLEGELFGVPRGADGEPESDAGVRIKLRVEDYLRLADAGAFDAYGKTELIDGVVYRMSPQFRPHGYAKDELAYRLRRQLEAMRSALHVATEQSVDIAPHSEPQPDIILTAEPRGSGAIPVESVALIVEIGDSTAKFDLREKARLYAGAGIPEYWVVDLKSEAIRQLWAPEGETYAERREVKLGERIEATTMEGLAVETAGIN